MKRAKASHFLDTDVTEFGTASVPPPTPQSSPAVDEYAAPTELHFASFSPRMQVVIFIEAEKRVYRLREPFVILLEELDDGTIFASHRVLPVHGYGASTSDALEAFDVMFDVQWRNVVERDDSALTANAKIAKAALKSVVVRVEDLDTCQR